MSGPQSTQGGALNSGISVIMLMHRTPSPQHTGARGWYPPLSVLLQFVRVSQIMGIYRPRERALMRALSEGGVVAMSCKKAGAGKRDRRRQSLPDHITLHHAERT